jgi:ribonuclease P protein component
VRIHPISENHLYKKAYDHGKKYVCQHIVVYVLTDYHASRLQRENPLKQKINRIGLAVSKKTGGAVIRSRIRRILRAAYTRLEKECNVKKGYLVVIVARSSAASVKSTDIYENLYEAMSNINMIETGDKNAQ